MFWIPFQVTDDLLLKEGESLGLASCICVHPLRTWAEECVARAKIKEHVRKHKTIVENDQDN